MCERIQRTFTQQRRDISSEKSSYVMRRTISRDRLPSHETIDSPSARRIDGESTDNDFSIRHRTAEIVDFYERQCRDASRRSYKFERPTPRARPETRRWHLEISPRPINRYPLVPFKCSGAIADRGDPIIIARITGKLATTRARNAEMTRGVKFPNDGLRRA